MQENTCVDASRVINDIAKVREATRYHSHRVDDVALPSQAKLIHNASQGDKPRGARPFVTMHCAAVSKSPST